MYVPFSSDVTRIDILTQFHKIFGSRRRNIFIVLQKNQINVRKKQKGQSKDTGNIGHKTHKQTKPQQKGQSKDTGNIGHTTHKQTKPKQKGQSKDNPEKLTTFGTQDTEQTSK